MGFCKGLTHCRACGSGRLVKYLDLGAMPLANNLASNSIFAMTTIKFPLEVMYCKDCEFSQLSIVVKPELLFSNYVYRSSINKGYVDHCRSMAQTLKERFNLNENSFHIDIAGNDGALLREFKAELGHKILNIDPAENLAPIAEAAEIPTLTKFWNERTSNEIKNSYGLADLITATNVFAHVDNIKEFLQACKNVLKPNGRVVLEFPYLVDMITHNEFDTIYFEHLSYIHIRPLIKLCTSVGLRIESVDRFKIHGGSVRVTIKHDDGVEFEYHEPFDKEIYENWSDKVNKLIKEFKDTVQNLKSQGNKIAAFGASAKGNTLLNSANLTVGSVSYIVDETPEKIGKYSPGTAIPIVSMLDLERTPPDYLIILAWNFKEEIIKKVKEIYKGKFIIPIPNIEIIN